MLGNPSICPYHILTSWTLFQDGIGRMPKRSLRIQVLVYRLIPLRAMCWLASFGGSSNRVCLYRIWSSKFGGEHGLHTSYAAGKGGLYRRISVQEFSSLLLLRCSREGHSCDRTMKLAFILQRTVPPKIPLSRRSSPCKYSTNTPLAPL